MTTQAISQPTNSSRMSTSAYMRVLMAGMYFCIVLIKTEVVRWQRIRDMFLFNEPYMYLVIGTAVVVGGLSMLLIKRYEVKDMSGKPIAYTPKPYHKGTIWGGIAFGMGWAITGACPGPIYAQIGAGEPIAFLTFGGALVGMYVYAWLQPRLPH